MKETLVGLFAEHKTLIVFVHVLSAVVWVGGMVAMRFAAHHSFLQLREPPMRLERTAHALKRLFAIVSPFIVLLLVTAVVMELGLGLRTPEAGDMLVVARVKELVWVVMALNFAAMLFRRNRVQKLIEGGDLIGAKAKLSLIGSVMVPLNIILGLGAIYLGVMLRHAY